jgi:3-oxoadipate enol-lactonase
MTGYDPRVRVTGSGAPVVLVPGMDGTGLLFYRQVPALARAFRVATYALRDSARTMGQLVEDLAAVVSSVAAEHRRAIVIGESFGGALALSFALAHPEQVQGLVVLNSFPYFRPQIRLHAAIAGLSLLPWGTMGLIRRATVARMHSAHTHRAELRRFLELTRAATREGYVNRLRILTQYDVRDRLPEIEAPALFLAAEHDHLVPSVEQARFMAARVPHAVLRILAGHGHICLIAPDLALERIVSSWAPEG